MATILIVDDEDTTADLLALVIRRMGHTPVKAQTGCEALELAQKQPVDLILQDLMMPDMGGLEVCRLIRAEPHLANVPILVLTASVGEAKKEAAYKAGASDYLTKPFSMAELKTRIQAQLQGSPVAN